MKLENLKTGQLVKLGYYRFLILGILYDDTIDFLGERVRSSRMDASENVKLAAIRYDYTAFKRRITVDGIICIDSLKCSFVSNKYIEDVNKWIIKSCLASQELKKRFEDIREVESCKGILHEIFASNYKAYKKFKTLRDRLTYKKTSYDIKENEFYFGADTNSVILNAFNNWYIFPNQDYTLELLITNPDIYRSSNYAVPYNQIKDSEFIDSEINLNDLPIIREKLCN